MVKTGAVMLNIQFKFNSNYILKYFKIEKKLFEIVILFQNITCIITVFIYYFFYKLVSKIFTFFKNIRNR